MATPAPFISRGREGSASYHENLIAERSKSKILMICFLMNHRIKQGPARRIAILENQNQYVYLQEVLSAKRQPMIIYSLYYSFANRVFGGPYHI